MPPNVLTKGHYYTVNDSKRAFYGSGQKDDYLAYMDKGIKSTKMLDYLEYTGNEEKSSGVFTAEGILTTSGKKLLREKLRNTDSIIWDIIISFEEKYGDKNMYSTEQAQELLKKVLPRFFREAGFNPDNITWYAGLHTNTDNQHIHLSFFENEPMRYNPQTKEYRYRWKGNIKKETFDLLKMDIEKHFLQPIEGIKRVRKLLTEEVKTVTKNCFDLSRSRDLKRLLRKLYEEIPYEGRIAYESENMNGCRDTVDAIVSFILTNGENAFAYKSITALIATRDKELLDLCLTHKIKNPEAYLYGGVFQRDLYRRMGNAVIKEVLKKRRDELIRAREIRHAKARQKYHLDSLTHCLLKSAEIAAYADQEAVDCFEEYRRKIELEDIKRKLREMEM